MKLIFLKKWKFWRHLLVGTFLTFSILFFTLVLIAYFKQDEIVQKILTTLNEDFEGEIEDSHISPFENFPYISIDLHHLKIYESKQNHFDPIVSLEDCLLHRIWLI
ncbi:MAG TPA: hypothetical protein EYG85_09550 [Crocinitomix sp.]|nr:hypothetical protein [Crocinitomix sp.]